MRASRVLAARPDRATVALAQLCEERRSEDLVRAPASLFVPPRLSPAPLQTQYVADSGRARRVGDLTGNDAVPQVPRQAAQAPSPGHVPSSKSSEHTDARRGKNQSRTKASTTDQAALDRHLGRSSSSVASLRAKQPVDIIPSDSREAIVDDERSSDLPETKHIYSAPSLIGDSIHTSASPGFQVSSSLQLACEEDTVVSKSVDTAESSVAGPSRVPLLVNQYTVPVVDLEAPKPALVAPSRIDSVRRPMTSTRQAFLSTIPLFRHAASHRQQLSGVRYHSQTTHLPTVFYETAGRIPTLRCANTYPSSGACISALSSQYDQSPLYHMVPASMSPTASLPQHVLMARKRNSRKSDATRSPTHDRTDSDTPTTSTTPYHSLPSSVTSSPSHTHSQQTTTMNSVSAMSPTHFTTSVRSNRSSSISSDLSSSPPPSSPQGLSNASQIQDQFLHRNFAHEGSSISSVDDCTPDLTFTSSPPASFSADSGSGSPDSSLNSSNYATTPLSTSPPSPTQLTHLTTQYRGKSFLSFQSASKSTGEEQGSSVLSGGHGGRDSAVILSHHEPGLR
jgi:terminal uridylyltransferase